MNMKKLQVKIPAQSEKSYDILIASNILEEMFANIKSYTSARKILIVTNETIYSIYERYLDDPNYDFVVLKDGEEYKNIESLGLIWQKALELKLERKDVLVALGGGVVGDMTGFAASTYLRGIDYIQIPTTLLAQVDSSVGGKTAINHTLGKNLIGTFYQPKAVFSDITTLKTLPLRELKTGLAEVIKYAFIEKTCNCDTEINLMDFLTTKRDNIFDLEEKTMIDLIEKCCKLKSAVVNQDEKEQGLRAILNFGHTIAHAIEKTTNYNTFKHGEAVAIGIKGAFIIAKSQNLINEEYFKQSIELLKLFELNYMIPEEVKIDDIIEAMKHDKKVQNSKIRFVLPVKHSEVEIFDNIENEIVINTIKELY